jgi:hypothetical protein
MVEQAANDDGGAGRQAKVWFRAARPTLALSAVCVGAVFFCAGLIGAGVHVILTGADPVRTLLFATVSPRLAQALERGFVPFHVAFTEPTVLAGLATLYGLFLLVVACSVMLPMRQDKPFALQAGVAGFFWAYLLTLLVLGELALDARVVPGVARMLWILLLYALIERLKYAYPPLWRGVDQFPMLADGMFALAATTIIQQGLPKGYDAALSGPLFILISFVFMVFNERRLVRHYVLQQMTRTLAPDEPGPGRFAMIAALRKPWKGLERLRSLGHDELMSEYNDLMAPMRRLTLRPRLQEAHPQFVGLLCVIWAVWGPAMALALWIASNYWLWILGVGR